MNIYDYLTSPDIAAHCQNIGHVFNPLEMAVIVSVSKKNMKKRHGAWREIIAEYPDMPIRASNCFAARESLHEYLRVLIAWEKKGLDVSCSDDLGYGLDNIFIHIPVPFEKGDLVEFVGDFHVGPCVLRNLPHWKPTRYERQLSGKISDGSDMIAWINFMDNEGRLNFNDGPYFLYNLKYFTGEYKGYDRFLPYLSYFMKENKEAPDVLIHSYNKIKAITEYEKNTSLLDHEFRCWTELIEKKRRGKSHCERE
jgi:hypothetical protein